VTDYRKLFDGGWTAVDGPPTGLTQPHIIGSRRGRVRRGRLRQ